MIPGQMSIDECIALAEAEIKMAPATFRGGPLEGRRRPVPEHGPAWVRYPDPQYPDGTALHWYAWKAGTKRTYVYVGLG